MAVALNVACTGVEPSVIAGCSGRGEVKTHTKNLVGYIIKVSGMWAEHLK